MNRIISQIAIAQLLFWASSFYVFHAMMPRWEAFYGWSRIEVTWGLTICLLATAACAPVSGVLIDRGFGRVCMVIGGAVASLCLLLLAEIDSLNQFYVIWLILGVCHSTILYEPCFAILTRQHGTDAKRAITIVTLVAGFAGSVSFPVAYLLAENFGWQPAMKYFSVVCFLSTLIAAHALGEAKSGYPDTGKKNIPAANQGESARFIITTARFWLTALAFAFIMLIHGSLLAHLIPLLIERDFALSFAVFVISLIGPMQVAGRVMMLGLQRMFSIDKLALMAFMSMGVGCLLLTVAAGNTVLVLISIALHGAGYGVISIARPAVTVLFFGNRSFGAVSGVMSVPFTLCFAVAPAIASVIWRNSNYTTLLSTCVLLAMISVILLYIASAQQKYQ